MSLKDRTQFMLRLISSKFTGARVPLVLVFNITNRCNLRCRYCYQEYYARDIRDFTLDEIRALVDEAAAMGAKSITLGGGEPLLRDDIGEVIAHIKSRKIECGMNTNGTLMRKRIEAVKKLDTVCVSLDGDEQANDANRGEKSFGRILDGLKFARDMGVKVHTNTVLTEKNISSIDWLMERSRQEGFWVEFNLPFASVKESANSPDVLPGEKETRDALRKIIDYKRRGYPILFSERVYRYAMGWPDYGKKMYKEDEEMAFKPLRCMTGRYMCFIDSDGKVYPCAQRIGTFDALSFLDVGFRRSWDHLAGHGCVTCYFACFNEFNSIFALNPGVIINNVMTSLKESRGSGRIP